MFSKIKDTAKKGIEKAVDGVDKTRELVAKQNQQTKVGHPCRTFSSPQSGAEPAAQSEASARLLHSPNNNIMSLPFRSFAHALLIVPSGRVTISAGAFRGPQGQGQRRHDRR